MLQSQPGLGWGWLLRLGGSLEEADRGTLVEEGHSCPELHELTEDLMFLPSQRIHFHLQTVCASQPVNLRLILETWFEV